MYSYNTKSFRYNDQHVASSWRVGRVELRLLTVIMLGRTRAFLPSSCRILHREGHRSEVRHIYLRLREDDEAPVAREDHVR